MAQKKDEKQSEWESREDMMPEDECKLQTKEKDLTKLNRSVVSKAAALAPRRGANARRCINNWRH